MTWQTFILYLATWSIVALTPGPAVMCSMAQSSRFGFRTSLIGISGIQCGNLLFFICVASGLAALLSTASSAFHFLRIAGAIYLFYLGIKIIRSTLKPIAKTAETLVQMPAPAKKELFLQGLLIQVTNPKALLFVSALLPQFIETKAAVLPQLALLCSATIIVDTLVLGMYAFFAERSLRALRNHAFTKWLERAFGATLILFGFKLLFSRNR